MNNIATVCITLFGMVCLDVFLVGPHGLNGSSGYDLQPVYMAEMPPVMQNAPAIASSSPERAWSPFAVWGEWRYGRIAARRFVIYDTSVAPARISPTPAWPLSADKPGPR